MNLVCRPFLVIDQGLDWSGFSVSLDGTTLIVGEGIVGDSTNPLPDGGWKYTGSRVELQPEDATIEVILYHDEVCLLVRSSDPQEIFPEELRVLFLLAWKEDKGWVYHYPERDSQYGKDIQTRKRHTHSVRSFSFAR